MAHPCCMSAWSWHIPHIQTCLDLNGIKGTKQSSNQVRDLAANMEAGGALQSDNTLAIQSALTIVASRTDPRALGTIRRYFGRTAN